MPKMRAPKGSGSVEQLPTGNWRVIVSRTDPLTRKRTKLSRTFPTQREAVAFKEKAEELLAKKVRAAATDLPRPDSLTLAGWLDEWLRLKKGKVEGNSWAWYEKMVRRCLKPVIGTVRLADVSSLLVERFMSEMRGGGGTLAKPVSAYCQAGALTTLRTALTDAVRHRLIDADPTHGVRKPKKEHREAKWWSPAEAAAFLSSPVVASHRLFALFRLALESGMRLGELLALRWADIDFTAGVVHVRRSLEEIAYAFREKAPKTRAGRRTLPLSSQTVDALASHRKGMFAEGRDVRAGVVFVSTAGTWLFKKNLHKLFRRLVRLSGVPVIRPYDLRHTAASMWLANGASIRAVADRLGHEDPAITLRYYAHCLPSEQGAIAQMAARLLQSHG
jgi:integrase